MDLAPGKEASSRIIIDKNIPNYDFISSLLSHHPVETEIESTEDGNYQFITSENGDDAAATDANMFANPLFLQQVLTIMGSNPVSHWYSYSIL